MATLTVDGYHRMGAERRAEFDEWLRTEGIDKEMIFEATFGDGTVTALRHKVDADGNRYLIDPRTGNPVKGVPRVKGQPDPVVASEEHTYPLTVPPPAFVTEYCEA